MKPWDLSTVRKIVIRPEAEQSRARVIWSLVVASATQGSRCHRGAKASWLVITARWSRARSGSKCQTVTHLILTPRGGHYDCAHLPGKARKARYVSRAGPGHRATLHGSRFLASLAMVCHMNRLADRDTSTGRYWCCQGGFREGTLYPGPCSHLLKRTVHSKQLTTSLGSPQMRMLDRCDVGPKATKGTYSNKLPVINFKLMANILKTGHGLANW